MLFIYNETKLGGELSLGNDQDKVTLNLGLKKEGEEVISIPLMTVIGEEVIAQFEKRFESPITVTHPVAKQYVKVPKVPTMYNTYTHSYESIDNTKDDAKGEHTTYHRNLIVLVLSQNSTYYVHKCDKVDKERVEKFTVGEDKYKVVMFYAFMNNWNALKRDVFYLIKSGYENHDVKLSCNYDTSSHTKDGNDIPIYTNRLTCESYSGEFPVLTKKRPANAGKKDRNGVPNQKKKPFNKGNKPNTKPRSSYNGGYTNQRKF